MKNHWKKFSLITLFLIIIMIFVGYHFHEYLLVNDHTKAFPVAESKNTVQFSQGCDKKIYSILSIDGGGARGIIPLFFLTKIEEATQTPIRKSFDLIAGVSVGGILAAKLSLPDEKGRLTFISKNSFSSFKDMVGDIFYNSPFRKVLSMNGVLSPLYSADLKYTYLKKLFPESYTIHNLVGNTIIVAFDYRKDEILIFSNCKECSSAKTDYSLVDILSGSSSPLGFFRPHLLYNNDGKINYILSDSSYSLSNPSLLAYWYGKKICPAKKDKYYFILSLGTGHYPNPAEEKKHRLYFGAWHWLPGIFMGMLEGGYSEPQRMMENTDDNKLIYIRINPSITESEAYPLTSNPDILQSYIKSSQALYDQNKPLFECIAMILKNNSLTKQCVKILNSNANSQGTQIVTRISPVLSKKLLAWSK